MTSYILPITDDTEVTVTVTDSFQGLHASGYLTATHEDGSSEDFGHLNSTHYIDYCLTDVVALEAIRLTGNYPRLSDGWNVWEALSDVLPECVCE